ncbi:MAG: Cna B-type domain-containing protein [Lachnospiraceae bacterium]|nr:Cna B-type domain-containing protein [Lachnospiraceae bacterium]
MITVIKKLKEISALCMQRQIWRRIVMTLSCIVVFVTTYMMILPAITLERNAAEAENGIEIDAGTINFSENELSNNAGEEYREYGYGEADYTENAAAEDIGEGYLKNDEAEDDKQNIKSVAGTQAFMTGIQTVIGSDYVISAEVSENARIPADANLVVDELTGEMYESYYAQVLSNLGASEMPFARFFDIRFEINGDEIQPAADVNVTIELAEVLEDDVKAVHFEHEVDTLVSDSDDLRRSVDDEDLSNALDVEPEDDENRTETNKAALIDSERVVAEHLSSAVSFTANSFSVYGIVGTVIEKNVLASDGKNYKVTVTYGAETGIPEGAELEVEEILPDENGNASTSSAYDEYVAKTENAFGMEEGSAGYIRLFDIKIMDKDDHEIKYQPAEGTTVDVKIELADMEEDSTASVVHFDENEKAVRLDNTVDGDTVSFETGSFSVFAVAVFDDIIESTPYMNIRVHSAVPMVKALKNAEATLFEGMDVVEAYEVIPHSSLVQITVDITSLPESNPEETYELCIIKDGSVSSIGEAALDSVFTFWADEADAFALVKAQTSSHTLTGAYGIKLSGNFPEGAYAVVKEAEPVEMEDSLPEISFAYDIKIYDANDKEWQPNAGETVECFIPYEGTQEELEEYYWVVLHTSDVVTEQLYDACPVNNGIRFTTGSFSTFTAQARISGTTYGRPTTVHFVDHFGNEIQGMTSGSVSYTYQQYYDLYQYQDDLNSDIADEYEFSRVYVQLSGIQKDIRYLYLGTVAEVDGSGSGYRVYMFMNNLDECKSGGTYAGTYYTGTGNSATNDVYIVFNHVEDISFRKVDDDGEPLSGAGFTLYTDNNCVNVFTYNGTTVTATSDESGEVSFGRIPYGTYYMKETTTPAGLKETGTVYTVNVNGNTSIGDIVNEDDDGSVIVKETKMMNITKEWSDGEDHSNDSVTIKLFDQGTEAGSVTLNAGNSWSQSISNLDPTASYMVSETAVTSSGEDVTNGWIPEISSRTTSTSTGYYQTDVFQQGEQYVLVYNGNTALRYNSSVYRYYLGTDSVTVQGNMISSTVNNNMLWQVDSVSDDGVIVLKNVASNRYLNYPYSSNYQRWCLNTSVPQFIRYTKNGSNIQLFYRQNINDSSAVYLNGTSTSSGSGTNFTLYKKVNVRTENVTVTNKPAEYPVMIQKLEYSSNAAIPGTTFSLYTEDEYNNGNLGTPTFTGLTSGSNGYLTTDGSTHIQLLAGTYYLVETNAATGYVDLSKPVKFMISRGGRFTARSADQEFTDYTYASTVTDGGTSYPLLKVPNQKKITLTFKAEDGVDIVQFVSGAYIEMTGDGTKELKVVIPEVTGSSIKVIGVGENGKVINGWTINDETVKLTTANTISTAINDDADASNTWTDRTYHVWAETEKKVNITKEVNVLGSVGLDDIDTTVYFVVWDHTANRNVLDENGDILIKSIQIINGVPQGTVTFDGLTSGTYSVWEVDASGNDLAAGTVVIGDDIAVSKITTAHGEDSGNRVTLTEDLTTDGITVTNTYNHESDVVDWTISKEWYTTKNLIDSSEANKNIPANATSTLSLFREDDPDTPIQTIVLDGTTDENGEDVAWKATFTDIPIKDSSGDTIKYIVKETAFTPETTSDGLYITAYTDQTDHDGGTIRNAVLYGDINIYKEFVVQPERDLSGVIGDLDITVTGPHGYNQTFTLTGSGNNYSLNIPNLPAGTYHVKETGYENLIEGRKWNADGSYIMANIMPSDQSSSQGQMRYGETETDALVGTLDQSGASTAPVEIRMKNDYSKMDITAAKVWSDSDDVETHEDVTFTLYRVDGDTRTQAGEPQTIAGDAAGEDLTVVWEQMDQQYTYIVEENPVYGYTTQVTGDALTGFTVTNTPKEQTELTVVKIVEGTEYAKQKTYKVKVTPEGFADEAQILELQPVNGEDSKTIQVPYGTYTVEELLSDTEDSSYTIEIDGYDRTTSISIGSGNGEETVSKTASLSADTASVTVTNSYKRQTTDVSFIKLDGGDHSKALSAEFQIEYSADNVNYTTINNGQVTGVVDSVFAISETGISLPLTDGYYRLTERTPPDGYHQMNGTIVFSVSDGLISLLNASECEDYAIELKQEVTEDEQVDQKTIGLELYNYERVPVSIWKTDFDKNPITSGASFVLYKADNFDDETQDPIEENQIVTSGITDADGILLLGELELGEYRLVETKAPNGYLKAEHAIKIFVRITGISAMQETGYSDVNYKGDVDWVTGQGEKTAQIRIWNNPGVVLPSTGGPGTNLIYLIGIMLTGIAGAGLMMRKRKQDII